MTSDTRKWVARTKAYSQIADAVKALRRGDWFVGTKLLDSTEVIAARHDLHEDEIVKFMIEAGWDIT